MICLIILCHKTFYFKSKTFSSPLNTGISFKIFGFGRKKRTENEHEIKCGPSNIHIISHTLYIIHICTVYRSCIGERLVFDLFTRLFMPDGGLKSLRRLQQSHQGILFALNPLSGKVHYTRMHNYTAVTRAAADNCCKPLYRFRRRFRQT